MHLKMRNIFLLILLFWLTIPICAQDENKNLLVQASKNIDFKSAAFPNYPTIQDREFWNNLPKTWKHQYIVKAEESLNFNWPITTAQDYLDFVQIGSRKGSKAQRLRKMAFETLVIAECIEAKGRFLPQIINGVFAFSEQTTWSNPAHLSLQKSKEGLPDYKENMIDLSVGEIGADMALAYYLLKDKFDQVDKRINQRIEEELTKRILKPYLERDDFWWFGFNKSMVNNWNPWCNFNVLNTLLIIEKNPVKKEQVLRKIVSSLDQFINYTKDDGGCEEGATYWGHAGGKLFETLDLLKKMTKGNLNIFGNKKIQSMALFPMYAHVKEKSFINFADSSPLLSPKPGLYHLIAELVDSDDFRSFSQEMGVVGDYKNHFPGGNLATVLPQLIAGTDWLDSKEKPIKWSSYYYDKTELLSARDEEFFFAAKGGYNNESHNHNDVGTCILYFKGIPLLADAGVGTYTRKTFSKARYEIWTMQSDYHNVPKINGVSQKHGNQFKAKDLLFDDDKKEVAFSLDISDAYPEEAKVKSWRRSYTFVRGQGLTVVDDYVLKAFIAPSEIHFLTCANIEKIKDGLARLDYNGTVLEMSYDSKQLELEFEDIELKDQRLQKSWKQGLQRIILKTKQKKKKNRHKITFRKLSV